MKDQYYSYALDSEGRLVNINDAIKGQFYSCPNCGDKMIIKEGKIRRKHFAHKSKLKSKKCSYDTYLHKIAERKIGECFNNSSKFIIKFRSHFTCAITNCPLGVKNPCSWNSNKYQEFDLKQFYNFCTTEYVFDKFRADLVISNADKTDDKNNIYIEIYVTHKSSEEKLNSGYRIIEIHIQSEEDIERIVRSSLIKESDDDKICFYNFRNNTPIIPAEELQSHKYRFWIDSRGLYHFNDEVESEKCLRPNPPEIENSLFRIESKQYIERDFAFYKLFESGIRMRYCDMCKHFIGKYYYTCSEYRRTMQLPALSHATICPGFEYKDYIGSEHSMDKEYNQEFKITIKN